jgi:hypothetical protein
MAVNTRALILLQKQRLNNRELRRMFGPEKRDKEVTRG